MKPHDFNGGNLIPGLPNEVSELCLLHLPFPYFALLRSVSSPWNRTLSNPSFFETKSKLFFTKPYIITLTAELLTHKIQWQFLDPVSKSWFFLPPMPIPCADMVRPSLMACSVDKEKGEMYVFGADSFSSVMVYSAASNSWRTGEGRMKICEKSFFTSAAIGGKVYVFGGEGDVSDVQCYDPVLDSWACMAEMTCIIGRYDAAVIDEKVFLTEGWTWPFNSTPQALVYNAKQNTWQNMPDGMREGWTGSAATVGPDLFVLSEVGDRKAKVYDPESDTWLRVIGNGIPETVKRPYKVTGNDNGKIYVVGKGLDVAIGTLVEIERKKWGIEWDVVEGCQAFVNFIPFKCQVLHA